jgi:diguanylate cyclase (GGDEF)-like protein
MSTFAPTLRAICLALMALTVAIALLVLIGGWALDVAVLRNVVPGTVAMKPWTALGLLSAATALRLLLEGPSPRARRAARAAAAFPLLLGAAVLSEYVLGWDLGIDELLFVDAAGHAAHIAYPGRFAPTTALCFVLIGFGLLALDAAPRRGWRIAELAMIPVAGMGAMTLVGYLYAIPVFYGPASAAKMALNTGVCFLAMAAAIVLARPHGHLVRLAGTRDPGGIMLRRLLPLAIVLPLLLGWAKLRADDAGLFSDRVGTWWLSVATIVALCLLIGRVATRLSHYARQRDVLEIELQRLANHDPLTGLLNRRRFDEELTAAAARAARSSEPCSVLVMDFDRMKRVNDSLGHAAGDELLQRVGAILRERVRASDVGARVGGDEFAILLPNTEALQAVVLAASIRAAVAACRVPTANGEAWTTVSIGIAQINAADALGESAMQRADEAMYRRKREGGDGVLVAEPAEHAVPAEPPAAAIAGAQRVA